LVIDQPGQRHRGLKRFTCEIAFCQSWRENQQHGMRRIGVELSSVRVRFRQFGHQAGLVLETPCRIDEQYIGARLRARGQVRRKRGPPRRRRLRA